MKWTAFHVQSFGSPLCGTRLPDQVQRWTEIDARPEHWRNNSICGRCREALARAQKRAGSGEAADARNELTGQAGPVGAEVTAPAGNEQSV